MAREEYKGPDAITAAMGKGSYNGQIGGLAGAAGGAVVGALVHSKSAVEAVETGAAKGFWTQVKGTGRGWKAIIGALVGALVVGGIAQWRGYLKGAKQAEEGRAQFERLSAENEQLQNQIESQKSFTAQIKDERAAEKSQGQAR